MGSKMSFSRGSSDQNTVSELTSVTPHPRNIIHAPSDCKQIPEGTRCSEEDLASRWGEEMKATELTESAPESHSSGYQEHGGHVNSETAGGTNSQESEHTSSQVGTEAKPLVTPAIVCSSTTDSRGHPVRTRRRRKGRPRRPKQLLTADKTDPDVGPALDAVQHEEISTTIPLPVCLETNVPNTTDAPLITNSAPHIASDVKVEDVLPKKKRGRPKRGEMAAVDDAAASPHTNNVSRPAWRLRSRAEPQPSTQDGNTTFDIKVEPEPAALTLTESGNTLSSQAVKRRPRHADQQVPAKVSRLDVSQETSSDKQVELYTDKHQTDTDAKEGQSSTRSELLPQTELRRRAADRQVSPAGEDVNCANLTSELQIKQSVDTNSSEELQLKSNADFQNKAPSSTDVITSPREMLNPVQSLQTVKTENIEMELDHFRPVSESKYPKTLQYSANVPIKSEPAIGQRNFFRRKRGGKRRRRVNNVLLQSEQLVENFEGDAVDAAAVAAAVAPQKTECDDVDQEVKLDDDANVIYTKRGTKTLLKCGYCGRTFKFLSQFVIHQRIHTGERPFKCQECGKGFSKNSNLNLHLKTHRKSNIYQKCPYCNIKFSCSEYASHMQMHAHELARDSENNKTEKQSSEKEQETSPGHETPNPVEKRQRKVCQYCGKTFPFQSALIRHVRVHTGEKPYKCDICGKAFGQAYFLRVHELTHWSVKRYNCTRCEKSFTHYSNAKNHTCRPVGSGDVSVIDAETTQPNRRVKPSLTYTCHICKNVFDHLQEFNSHMRAHTGAKLYRCLYCDKLFGVLSEFNSHRSQCRGERNASCSTMTMKEEERMSLIQYTVPALRCSTGHNSAAPLVVTNCETPKKQSQTGRKKRGGAKKPFQSTVIPAHHLSHLVSKLNKLDNRSDPRKYLCPSCGRLFRHMGRLRAHMLTHAPGQSYTCACCGKTLENWKKLWRHQRIHRHRRGRFTCPQCGRGFRFVELYKKHMSEHPDFQWIQVRPKKVFLPYQCDQCRCSFKTLDLLFNHQLCHSTAQDKDAIDLSIDDHTLQVTTKTLSPSTNSHIETLHPEPDDDSSTQNLQDPDSAPPQSPVELMSLDLSQTSTHLTTETCETFVDISVENEHEPGKPITPLRTVKKQSVSISNDGSGSDGGGIQCAVCGVMYAAISDLYHHYLQHARGQL